MHPTRVAVLGSINMDLTAVTDRLPAPGETVLGDTFTTAQGGKGANQAIAAARSGSATTFLGAVGDDAFASELTIGLNEASVDTTHLRTVDGPSGIAVITVDSAGENSIVVIGGANATVAEPTTEELEIIAGADILLCQFEIPIPAVTAAAQHARAHGTLVVLNPSPVQAVPDALLEALDVLVVNEAEASALGSDVLGRIAHVVTTRGAAGARYVGPAGSFDVPAPVVDATDTTGAGDAFTGALAARWAEGPEAAVRWACAAGAFAASRRGAGASSGTREQIESVLA
ncbi:ribokinase [Rhodococcoides kyotonense]|uniref:Ribokinase n=1 Tax=Rhodococcoides kyotonense TaxID=398843 RepID=A0A239HGQ7_9NOCA|nr:ribokinase [Rhodococcus kyotonensis]SNS80335.1 ribokinase [Rhodococcus kyotonensis]